MTEKIRSDGAVKIAPTEALDHILLKSHQSTGHGGRDKMLYNLKSPPQKAIVVCPVVSSDFNHRGQVDLVDLTLFTEKDLDQFVKQQHNGNASTSEDLPAAELINNNVSTLEDLPAVELINNNASASEDAASTARTPVLLVAPEGKAVDREEKAFCVVCGMKSTGTHLVSRKIWVENIYARKKGAPHNLKRFAEKMKDTSSKKFKDVLVGSTVLIDVPKVDRSPLNANNITRLVLNIKKNI
ncbi:hypothetical protein ILUMI_12415 [Ignelater luminosus]|uniref:Uncharacterized protein n=1 Tax=Ignelater luminosus TaxID=2038154 RepID=A0A8K0G6T2_IGNLU|nr:hypothetical protein ILUMI_12415 [Ignelater luminosus]